MKANKPLTHTLPEISTLVEELVKDKNLLKYQTYGGAYCKCDEASAYVASKLDAKGVKAETLFLTSKKQIPYKVQDPYTWDRRLDPEYWHMVVLVEGKYVLDFTARQYNPKVPFPVAWELKSRVRPIKTPDWDLLVWKKRGQRHVYQGRKPCLG